jgi:hypothetical protein
MIEETDIRLSRRHCWTNRSASEEERKRIYSINLLHEVCSRVRTATRFAFHHVPSSFISHPRQDEPLSECNIVLQSFRQITRKSFLICQHHNRPTRSYAKWTGGCLAKARRLEPLHISHNRSEDLNALGRWPMGKLFDLI